MGQRIHFISSSTGEDGYDLEFSFEESDSIEFIRNLIRFMRGMGFCDTVILRGIAEALYEEELDIFPQLEDADSARQQPRNDPA